MYPIVLSIDASSSPLGESIRKEDRDGDDDARAFEAEEEEEEEEAEKSERTEPDEEDPILRVKKELLPPNAGLSNDGDDHKKS